MSMFPSGQWAMQQNPQTQEWEIVNTHADGQTRDYYRIVMGEYSPVIEAEPDRAFEVPQNLACKNKAGEDVEPQERIAGIICKDSHRFSLTNADRKGVSVSANKDGSIQVGDEVWWVKTLFQKDKNRIFGYDAYCVKEQPDHVTILELADLDLF